MLLSPNFQFVLSMTKISLPETGKILVFWAINTKGEELFKVDGFDNRPDAVRDGLFRIEDDKGWLGFADMGGNIVIPPKFKWVDPFHEGLAVVNKG